MELTQEIVRELIDYNSGTGRITWRKRDIKWFASEKQPAAMSCKSWNSRFAGKEIKKRDKDGYFVGTILGQKFRSHRVIWLWMTGEWPDQVDHINGIKDDNRWFNLRNVSNTENARNTSRKRNNKSGQMGVWWSKGNKTWQASITINKVPRHLGSYQCFELASLVRSEAEAFYNFSPLHGRPFINYSV
jgi:hypothetical protein